jgi:hypothetical protein
MTTVKGIKLFIGIYKEKNCSQTMDRHALQLVGLGNTESGELYWIAKNSWGLFIHYALNKSNIEAISDILFRSKLG